MRQRTERAHADHFYLTHAALAPLVRVRRSGVTRTAGTLQSSGFIHYSRGDVTVLDRQGLEGAFCACYATVRADHTGSSAKQEANGHDNAEHKAARLDG